MLRVTRNVSGLVPRGNNKGNRWPQKHTKDYWLDATFIKNRAKRIAFSTPPPTDKWAIPSHPKDVIREEIIEDHFNRKKSIRIPLDAPLFDEERYASMALTIGTVHRRIGKDRVELAIKDAKYHEFTQKFTSETGLIVVHDDGQTRIGDFILAKLVDKNDRISTHKYMRTIRVKGMSVCPFTGMRVRQNRLVDEPVLSIEESHALFDATAADRVHNFKYRDDLNRDYMFYELKWNNEQLTDAIEEGKKVAQVNKKQSEPDRAQLRRKQRINRIKDVLALKKTRTKMTDETNAALMFTILPSISRVCSGDPETARKLREIFVKTEKHATGFSGDFVAALYDESGRTNQFTYEATMLALSGQDMNEFRGMSQIEEQHPQLRQRADSLKKLLSSIPRVITERPVFLETIKDIAAAIRELLDVLKDMIRANGRSRTIRDVLERSKRDFVKASKQFSDSLKQYFQERSQRQQSGVFKSANALSQQTNTLLMNMTSVVFE